MSQAFRFDFPPEVVQEREQVFTEIFDKLSDQTREGLEQAICLYRDWTLRFPDDFVALDFGSTLAMSEAAYATTERSDDVTHPTVPREFNLTH